MFQQHFLSTAEKVVLEAEKSLNQSSANPNANVYFISAFSVPESKRPELKVEFRELLVRFMKANEQPCSNHFYFLSHSF